MKDITHRSSGNIFLDLGFPVAEAEIVSDTTSKKLLLIELPAFKDGNRLLVHDGEAIQAMVDIEFFSNEKRPHEATFLRQQFAQSEATTAD